MWDLLVGACEVFLIAECRIFIAASQILLQHMGSLFVACGIFAVAYSIFWSIRDIFSCRMQDLLSACGILLRHVGSLVVAFGIFVKASGVFNCGRQDLHCAIWGVFSCDMWDLCCGMWDLCCSMLDFFFFFLAA